MLTAITLRQNTIRSKRILSIAFFMLTFASRSEGQKIPKIRQESTRSVCSNVVALAGNVNLRCSNLTPAQQKLLVSIPVLLRKVLAQQPDPDLLIQKLDTILATSKSETQTCVGSNCFQGQNFGKVTQNQYGPPTLTLSVEQASQITSAMREFAGIRIAISIANQTQESSKFAYSFADALSQAGMEAPIIFVGTEYFGGGAPPSGMWLTVGDEATPTVKALELALQRSGVISGPLKIQRDEKNPKALFLTVYPGV